MEDSIQDLIDIFNTFPTEKSPNHVLILDPSLSNKLNYLTNNNFSTFIKSCNIERTIWYNDTGNYNTTNNSIVILLDLMSDLGKLNSLQLQLANIKSNTPDSEIHLIFAHPLLKTSIDTYIKQTHLDNLISSYHVWKSLKFIKLPDNVYSLEYINAGFKDIFLNNSPIALELQANLLLQLYIDSKYTLRITHLFLKGEKSILFWKIYKNLLQNHLDSLSPLQIKTLGDIDETLFINNHSFYNNSIHLISLDRSNDLISVLLNQLTYSGLTNEMFHLNQYEPLIMNNKLINFNDEKDSILNKIKHLNFSHVGPVLNKNAKSLQTEFDKRKKLDNITQMKNFVSKIEDLKSLQSNIANHTLVAEKIINSFEIDAFKTGIDILDDLDIPVFNSYYTRLIDLQQSILAKTSKINVFNEIKELALDDESKLHDIFKLIILSSIVRKGVLESDISTILPILVFKFKTEKVVPIYINLIKLKIITIHKVPHSLTFNLLKLNSNQVELSNAQNIIEFSDLSKSLNLLPEHDDQTDNELDPNNVEFLDLYNDADFAYPGYVPITTRLIQSIYTRSFINERSSTYASTPSSHSLLYGWNNLPLKLSSDTVEECLIPDSKKKLFSQFIPPKISELKNNNSKIIISMIGGLTLSEISTIKYVLSKIESTKHKELIFLTTGIINTETFIDSLQSAN